MRIRAFFGAVALLAIVQPVAAYACGDMRVCVKNPPFPPQPPTCVTYTHYCADVLPGSELFKFMEQQAPQPSAPGYSVQLNNLSKDEVEAIYNQLHLNPDRIKVPE